MKTKKILAQQIIMTVLAVGFLGYVGYIGYDKNKSETAFGTEEVKGDLVAVTSEKISVNKVFDVSTKGSTALPIYSTTGGVVKRLVISNGQQVQKGDLLAIITGSSNIEGLSARKSESLEYIQQLKNILKNLEQSGTLGDTESIAVTDEQKEYHRVKEALKRAEANHSIIVSEVETRNVFAPISGIVQNISVEMGSSVNGNSSLLLEIKPFQSKEVIFKLSNEEYRLLQDRVNGASVSLVNEEKNKIILTEEEIGTLKAYEIGEDSTIEVVMHIKQLYGSFKVSQIVWDIVIDAVVVPENAVFKEDNQYFVWKVVEGKENKKCLVDVVIILDNKAVIRKGLSVGDQVISLK